MKITDSVQALGMDSPLIREWKTYPSGEHLQRQECELGRQLSGQKHAERNGFSS